ncbi:MAG: hypothetical protein ABIL58_16660 [Pseudomonadota bacterium]
MKQDMNSKNISQLLREADELIQKMEADAFGDLQETQQLEFEAHAQKLKEIKAMVQVQDADHSKQEINTGADGMHRAIDEIVKSMQELTKKFF